MISATGPGRGAVAILKAVRISSGSAVTDGTWNASFAQVLKNETWSKPWLATPFSLSGSRFAPGPTVTSHTPGRPVRRA